MRGLFLRDGQRTRSRGSRAAVRQAGLSAGRLPAGFVAAVARRDAMGAFALT